MMGAASGLSCKKACQPMPEPPAQYSRDPDPAYPSPMENGPDEPSFMEGADNPVYASPMPVERDDPSLVVVEDVPSRVEAGSAPPGEPEVGGTAKVENEGAPAPTFTSAPVSEERELPPPLFWNAWVEPKGSKPKFKPQERLAKNTSYLVVLDLSAREYGGASISGAVGERVRAPIQEAIDAGEDEIQFEVLILPDPLFFEAPSQRKETLKIDLKKLKQTFEAGKAPAIDGAQTPGTPQREPPVDAFAELKQNANAEFSFGRMQFALKTRNKPGVARIALSVWLEGRPIEELVFDRCIAADAAGSNCKCGTGGGGAGNCEGASRFQQGLSGVDSLRKGAVPHGALHLIEFTPGQRMVAVFRRANVAGTKDPYVTWQLDKPQPQLKHFMRETLFSSLYDAVKVRNPKSTDEVRERGLDLFRLMFPEQGFDKRSPRQEFKKFVQHYIDFDGIAAEKPSLFVRLMPAGDEQPLMVPFGLMAVPVVPSGAGAGASAMPEFLGFHFRIELPLELQSYEQPDSCVSRWVFVMPQKNEQLKNDALQTAIATASGLPEWLQKHNLSRTFDAMQKFRDWIGASEEDPPTGLVLLSHHAHNAVWFQRDELLTSMGLTRKFNGPSLAVLNACDTLEGGTSDFIQELNKRGVYSVIATSVPIGGDMAGEFLNCFTEELSALPAGDSRPVSSIYFKTLQCLKDRPEAAQDDAKFGPRALVYALLGNGSLPLCPPEKKE